MSITIKRDEAGWKHCAASAVTDWKSPADWQSGDALLLPVDAELLPEYAAASTIGVDFPAFTDGRGLSLAVLIRTRLKYAGELRALGATHEDVLHFMVRCGFDVMELPADRDAQTALRLLEPYSGQYQGSVSAAHEDTERVQRWA